MLNIYRVESVRNVYRAHVSITGRIRLKESSLQLTGYFVQAVIYSVPAQIIKADARLPVVVKRMG